MSGLRPSVGRVLYGLLFTAVLPATLIVWARTLDRVVAWPIPPWTRAGAVLAMAGALLMLAGMATLMRRGRGLPMNAYPPPVLVTGGIYRVFAHPIYLGAFLVSAGLSWWRRSSAGLTIVTPVLGLMMLSLLYGYELPALRRRFGAALARHQPLFALPASGGPAPEASRRLAMALRFLVPWFLSGYLLDYARHGDVYPAAFLVMTAPLDWPAWWTVVLAAPAAAFVVGILSARTAGALRDATVAAHVWSSLTLWLYLVLPALGDDLARTAPWLAVVELGAAVPAWRHRAAWGWLRAVAERVANSRRDWQLAGGALRVISHAGYAFAAGAIGAMLAWLVVPDPRVLLLCVVGMIVGGAVYAQVSWGGGALLRPFGFWGAAPGLGVAMFASNVLFGTAATDVLLAAVLAAPFAQAVGRVRCLAQGCCHGVPIDEASGIRVWHPQSRVVALSGLAGRWIAPTQLWSILFNLALGPVLITAWLTRAVPVTVIVGLYFALTGIERFAEDAWRGETQTRTLGGLKEPQWLALLSIAGGIAVSCVPSPPPAPAADPLAVAAALTALIAGVFTALAMSVDFPRSSARFSRLSG